jgi:hypothetical protein
MERLDRTRTPSGVIDTLCRRRISCERCRRPYRPADQFTFAVWTDIPQPIFGASAAKSALKAADSCVFGFVREIAVAAFTAWTELQHGLDSFNADLLRHEQGLQNPDEKDAEDGYHSRAMAFSRPKQE